MGKLRGRRRRLSSTVGTAEAAGQKCQKKNFRRKDVFASAPLGRRLPGAARRQPFVRATVCRCVHLL